jgi:hypothetical protein
MPPPARHRTPTHRPTSPTTTDFAGRLMASLQETAPPQQCLSKDATAHPHQPGARPDPPHPDRAHSETPPPSQSQGQVPITEQNFLKACGWATTSAPPCSGCTCSSCAMWYVSAIPFSISTTFCLSYVPRIFLTALTFLQMTFA